MGITNENVFKCRLCNSTVVYEPQEGRTISATCFNCKAEHLLTVPKTIIELT